MTECSLSRGTPAQSAVVVLEKDRPDTGKYSASITTTTPARFGASFATTATSLSDEAETSKLSNELSAIYSVTSGEVASIRPCGREEVFDIQVERTENFIANGLISHNTRWHEEDLAGAILPEGWAGESGMIECRDGELWEVICIPAKATRADDPLGRLPGEYIWPEWFGEDHWKPFERLPRTWSALYQQVPSPETGDYFKREWLLPVNVIPPLAQMQVYGASDYAVTADGGDYTCHVVLGVDHMGRAYLLDLWRAQASSNVWVDAFCALVRKWKPIGWAEETGQIKSGVGPFLVKRMLETQSYTVREQFPTRGDKAVRAQSIRGRMAMQGLYVPRDAPWLADFITELMSFPVGVHDDQVDALGLVGQLLDRMGVGDAPKDENRVAVHRAPRVVADGVIAPPLRAMR